MTADQATPRVVVLTPYFRPIVGGVESNAERLARYLQQHGFAVRVLTKRVTKALPDVEDMDGVQIERIGPYGDRAAAGKWLLLPQVAEWLGRERSSYDVVCCIDYRGTGVAAVGAGLLTRRPAVFQAQTTGVLSGANMDAALARWRVDPSGTLGRMAKGVPRTIYRRADAFACISREIEREALACGIPRERVHYLPNAIDMTRFRPAEDDEKRTLRQQLGVPADAVVCLFVGRLSREKGLMELMEAWTSVPNALLLVGGPDMDGNAWNVGPAAREFAARHQLETSVRFLGSIDDVASLLQVADIVIQPSHFEALGLSAIEALASGVPVVASAVGGLLDFMVDGRNGTLCPPQDPPALAAAIRALVDDADLRRRLASNARASVLADYDEAVVSARFGALLRQLIKARA
ncbi:MAG TPA: glycosyltransferase family 4 protein [Vicinamibacterales bacterium]|jgi:glycosyltransferase involved in cell wall biosynthesis|nr:glycosyltransferase family 4 protein [Vicinamibacterales bacterium]